MRFDLEGLDVFFPYDYLYKEQYEYMLHLKRALDDKGHVLLEMPTGTGKTVCLVSLITSYQFQYPQTGKLIYCTRTVPEMAKCMEEIRRVIDYRTRVLVDSVSSGDAPDGGKGVLALCLSSRRNMCIHPQVLEEGDRDTVDSLCRNMTASWVRAKAGVQPHGNAAGGPVELCSFYEDYNRDGTNAEIPRGIYSLDDLKELGAERGWCPYFMTRHLLHHASILVYNYQYMLDPKVSSLVSRELEAESIVVFDEAHNIDNVCIEALSVTLDRRTLEASSRSVSRLQSKVAELKASDAEKLAKEYADLVGGLAAHRMRQRDSENANISSTETNSTSNNDTANVTAATDVLLAHPILSRDILEEAVPGNIRKAEHFVVFLKKVVLYLKTLLNGRDVENKTPLAFLNQMYTSTSIERKPLRFTYTRLNSLLRALEITSLEDFDALQDVANFCTIVATYLQGFAVITEPLGSIVAGVTEPLLQLCCLDASIAIRPVLERFQSVVITSGTLSPIDLYPKLLNFQPVQRVSLSMSTFRPCLLPLIVTRGSDQITISTRFEQRKDVAVLRNYGQLLIDAAATIPDGICCFFTSYQFMEFVVGQWDKMKILQQVLQHKLIYLETKDVVETTLALDNYKRACDCGRGAVFLSVARGKVAEGIDFDRHYGRCVLVFGVPYQYTLSQVLRARLAFMREEYGIKDNDFLTFDAVRQTAQCVGRVIRSKTDYGVVILADARYNRNDKRTRFPPWILQFLRETGLNLPTDAAMDQVKIFLRQMGQPIEQQSLHSILLNENQVRSMFQQHTIPASPIGLSSTRVKETKVDNSTPPPPPPPPGGSDGVDEDEEAYAMEMYHSLYAQPVIDSVTEEKIRRSGGDEEIGNLKEKSGVQRGSLLASMTFDDSDEDMVQLRKKSTALPPNQLLVDSSSDESEGESKHAPPQRKHPRINRRGTAVIVDSSDEAECIKPSISSMASHPPSINAIERNGITDSDTPPPPPPAIDRVCSSSMRSSPLSVRSRLATTASRISSSLFLHDDLLDYDE